jgi:hypothetical protein
MKDCTDSPWIRCEILVALMAPDRGEVSSINAWDYPNCMGSYTVPPHVRDLLVRYKLYLLSWGHGPVTVRSLPPIATLSWPLRMCGAFSSEFGLLSLGWLFDILF